MKTYHSPKSENLKVLKIAIALIILSLLTWLLAFNQAYAQNTGRLDYARMNVAEVLMEDERFSMLESLLPGTDLQAKLMSGDRVTVFAPTNAAFANLDQATVSELLRNPAELNRVLNAHWLSGSIYTGYFYNERYYMPNTQTMVPITQRYSEIMIGNAVITMKDVATRNGVIHVIDNVIMPTRSRLPVYYAPRATIEETAPKPRPTREYSNSIEEVYQDANDQIASRDVVATLAQYEDFSMLLELIEEAGLANALAEAEVGITIFAPTNKAFAMMDNNDLLALRNNRLALMQVLLTHVVTDTITEDELDQFIETGVALNKSILRMSRLNTPMVENARIIIPNLEATNGIIHGIDRVIEIKR